MSLAPVVLPPNEGQTIAIVGDKYRFLATGKETDGLYTQIDAVVYPGGGPPPHIHRREVEAFYILEGEITFLIDGEQLVATAGMFANVPIGVVHTFRNNTDRPARMIVTIAPAGLEELFLACGKPVSPDADSVQPPTPEEIETLMKLAPEYGVELIL